MSASGGDKFCLKWNEFDSNLHSAFESFREEKSFCDVSLLCEDFSAEAHRVILSASSEFFKSVFQKSTHQHHPFIYIKGIKPEGGRRDYKEDAMPKETHEIVMKEEKKR